MKFMKAAVLVSIAGLFGLGQAYAAENTDHMAGHPMENADTNHDGKISFEEFKAAHDQMLEKRFKRMDTNGDGYIDAQERQAMHDKMREMHKKHQEMMRQQTEKNPS